uniref:Uncharacterized protein n=1 Tax=Glossina austeni TaxID=7395 RepID=A0A1A9VSN2_GLOAU
MNKVFGELKNPERKDPLIFKTYFERFAGFTAQFRQTDIAQPMRLVRSIIIVMKSLATAFLNNFVTAGNTMTAFVVYTQYIIINGYARITLAINCSTQSHSFAITMFSVRFH